MALAATPATVPSDPPFWCAYIPADFRPEDCQVVMSADTAPAAPIDARYATAGPWAVTQASGGDAAGASYTLFYPIDLGANGVKHPLLTWGNGTGSTPVVYVETLRHLASWGFVVVASNSEETGWGTELLAAVQYMEQQDRLSTSAFHGHLDLNRIGALGHSQGATGALNATITSKGMITSTLAVNLPDPFWFWFNRGQMPNFRRLKSPVFFVTGSQDFLSTSTAQQNYYDQVSGPAEKAALNGAGHNAIQQSDNRLLGYVTAWMMYTLQGDGTARAAFVGDGAEINANPSWRNQTQKHLP